MDAPWPQREAGGCLRHRRANDLHRTSRVRLPYSAPMVNTFKQMDQLVAYLKYLTNAGSRCL